MWCVYVHVLHRVRLFVTCWTIACQASLSVKFSRQEYWHSHFLLQRIFLTQGSKLLVSCVSCLSRRILYHCTTWDGLNVCIMYVCVHTHSVVSDWVAQLYLTLCDLMGCSPPGFSCPWDSPGKNTGVGFHALLQEIFLTQGLNLGLLHCRCTPYHLSHQRSPYIQIMYI